ncbi:MAG: ROK family protein [Candidatus Eremiobacteraeota bacterium]|nr:ROK family protein [Candidatus Eremiobacteraeota bacterium]
MSGKSVRIGVDLGGTKIEVVALDEAGDERFRKRVPTPQGNYERTLETIVELVTEAERKCGAGTVGVGTPGAASRRTGRIKNANSTVLIGKPLEADLVRLLQREIRTANDANCFILSEAQDGAAHGISLAFGVILGTGVGGAIACDGRIVNGANNIAGEWGHNPLPWPRDDERPGPRCYCGKFGCLETWLSGPALARQYAERSHRWASCEDVVSDAENGSDLAREVVERYEDRLARGLSSVINLLDPGAIVLGGGLSNVDRFYANVPPLLSQYVLSDVVETALVRAAHGDASGVRGAAMLWP